MLRLQEVPNVSPRHTSDLLWDLHSLVLNRYRTLLPGFKSTEARSWPLTTVHVCSPSGPWAPTYNECSAVTGIICNMTLMNSGSHTQNNFSENYPQFGHKLSKEITSSVKDRKFLNNFGFKGIHIINLDGRPDVSGRICSPSTYISALDLKVTKVNNTQSKFIHQITFRSTMGHTILLSHTCNRYSLLPYAVILLCTNELLMTSHTGRATVCHS